MIWYGLGTVGRLEVTDGLQVIESKAWALNSAVECHLHTSSRFNTFNNLTRLRGTAKYLKIHGSQRPLRVLMRVQIAQSALREFLLLFAFSGAKCHPLRLALLSLFPCRLHSGIYSSVRAGTSGYAWTGKECAFLRKTKCRRSSSSNFRMDTRSLGTVSSLRRKVPGFWCPASPNTFPQSIPTFRSLFLRG